MALAVGDINNNFEKLRNELKGIKYPHQVNQAEAYEGLPKVFLPILNYAFLSYSSQVAQFINEKGFELFPKNDFKFMKSAFKLLLDHFNYKSPLNIEQFFQDGFAERKIILSVEVIQIVRQKHKALQPKGAPGGVKDNNKRPKTADG